ncbi:MAG: hypothetical protein HQM04_10665 [Magnetococcales bacterium]|nr:hypothetical protein [Magnetococcales bacterium]MBF0115486.1 hypothetical protein [Magnetococcales bacterium]
MEKQIRFAAAKALTQTAQDAQEEIRRQLPERFTIRTGWVAKGIRIVPATPNKLESTVVVKDEFMIQQETGGEKTSPFGDSLGVPVGARPTPTAVTRPSRFPAALLTKPGYFIAPITHGSKTMALWKRTGRGRRTRLTLMYVFARQVRLRPRFGFRETVRNVALSRFPQRFREAIRQALATAR